MVHRCLALPLPACAVLLVWENQAWDGREHPAVTRTAEFFGVGRGAVVKVKTHTLAQYALGYNSLGLIQASLLPTILLFQVLHYTMDVFFFVESLLMSYSAKKGDIRRAGLCWLQPVRYILAGRPGGVSGYPRAWYRSVS